MGCALPFARIKTADSPADIDDDPKARLNMRLKVWRDMDDWAPYGRLSCSSPTPAHDAFKLPVPPPSKLIAQNSDMLLDYHPREEP